MAKVAAIVVLTLAVGVGAKTIQFTWKDCGTSSTHARVTGVKTVPDPPVLGQKIAITGTGTLDEQLEKGTYEVKVKAGMFTAVDHTDNVCGDSSFDMKVLGVHLGSVTVHGPACPAKAGTLSLGIDLTMTDKVPAGIGSATITMTAKDQSGSALLCMTMDAHIVGEEAEAPWPNIMPLKSEYLGLGAPESTGNSSSNFVFLQRFPLMPAFFFYHTEVLVCPRSGFSTEDQSYLDGQIKGMTNFAEIPESWWKSRTAGCTELGYGGAMCAKECCSVGHGSMPLNKRQAVIGNANVNRKALFVYGTGSIDGATAFHDTCDHKCWSNWGGTDYNPLSNNCNTFTSTVLSCVYGLSQKKPNLGVSDMVTVHGKCPSTESASAVLV